LGPRQRLRQAALSGSQSKAPGFAGGYLQQLAKPLDGETSVTRDTAHGDGVYWTVAREGQDPRPVPLHNVLALTQDGEPGLFKCADGIKVIDAGKLGQS